MKKRFTTLAFMAVLMMITLSNTMRVKSTGAPIGSTGAPGESNCGKPGCHAGNNNINTGTGILGVSVPELSGKYIPGKTYNVTVSLQQQNIKRFGFSLSALGGQHISSGTLLVSDAQRTQIMAGSNQFQGRNYITYKSAGTDPYADNLGQWTFTWKAPETNEGPVTMYVAAIAANNDGTDNGDEVYTDSLVLDGFATGIPSYEAEAGLLIYPNPVKNNFTLSFLSRSNGAAEIKLYDLKGNKSYVLLNQDLPEGTQTLSLEKPLNAGKGIYLLEVRQAAGAFTHKLVIE